MSARFVLLHKMDLGSYQHTVCLVPQTGTEHACLRVNAFPLEESALEEFHGIDALPFPPKDTSIDIYPGMHGTHTLPPIPVGTWSTQMLMDVQGIAPHAKALYALGRDDASAWIQQQPNDDRALALCASSA